MTDHAAGPVDAPLPGPPADPLAGDAFTGLAPAAPPVQLQQRMTALIEVVLTSGFPTQLLVAWLLVHGGMPARTAEGGMAPAFVFTLSLVDAVLVVALITYFVRDGGERVRDVLLGRRAILPELFLGVGLVPLAFMLLVLVLSVLLYFVPQLHNVEVNPLGAMMQTRQDAAIFAVVVTLAGGVREEVQRAFVVHRFGQYLGGAGVGVVVYSLAFGLGHVQQGHDAMVATAALGALWGTVYLLRRSIVAPVVSHAAFNLIQLLKFAMLR